MRKVSNVLKNRALLTLLAIVMVWGSFTFMLVPKAQACPGVETDFQYYTDDTYATPCGYKIIACDCHIYGSGCVTRYYTVDYYPCE